MASRFTLGAVYFGWSFRTHRTARRWYISMLLRSAMLAPHTRLTIVQVLRRSKMQSC
jgi:hypothetical protein